MKWLIFLSLLFPILGRAEQDASFVRTKLTNIACWQIRALLNPSASSSFELGSAGDRWHLVFAVECTEKECVGERDRFEHFYSAKEMDAFLAEANRSGCSLKAENKSSVTPQEKQCLGRGLLDELAKAQGLTRHGVELLRQKATLPKPEFTMQCRDEVAKGWFKKQYEAWFR